MSTAFTTCTALYTPLRQLPRLLRHRPHIAPHARWVMTATLPTDSQKKPHAESAQGNMFASDVTFSSLGVSNATAEYLARCGITVPTKAQTQVVPTIMQGLELQIKYAERVKRDQEKAAADEESGVVEENGVAEETAAREKDDVNDVLMIGAETGSGKTLAYLLPYIEAVQKSTVQLKAVVLVPSRELCRQTAHFLKTYFENVPKYVVLAGGAPPDASDIRDVKVVIATPGALLNYFRFSQKADTSDKYIVVDEADMLLTGGFRRDVEEILDQPGMKPFATRKNRDVRERNANRLLFVGATYPHWTGEKVKSIVTWMKRRYPDIRSVQTEDIHKKSGKVSSNWYFLKTEEERIEKLVHILQHEAGEHEKIMVFGTSADFVQRACAKVKGAIGEQINLNFGGALQLHKLVPSPDREENLAKFRSGESRLIFCTDLGSRGLDLGNVTRVIELEFASNVVAYLHRIGRTARAGASGVTDHFYNDVSKPLADAIRERAEKETNVVEGVFSRDRSFRRKLRKRLANEALRDLTEVEIDPIDEEEEARLDEVEKTG